jgi:prophage regulatory protein
VARPKTINAVARAAAEKVSAKGVRLISRRQLLDKIPVGYPTIWKWMRQGEFPRGRAIGGKIAWVESEVDRWIAERSKVRLKGDPETAPEKEKPAG